LKAERSQEEFVDLPYNRQPVVPAVAPDGGTGLVSKLASINADIISIFFQRQLDFADYRASTMTVIGGVAGII
jgi:hypothetical protein